MSESLSPLPPAPFAYQATIARCTAPANDNSDQHSRHNHPPALCTHGDEATHTSQRIPISKAHCCHAGPREPQHAAPRENIHHIATRGKAGVVIVRVAEVVVVRYDALETEKKVAALCDIDDRQDVYVREDKH
eukprot:CAMPEP_0175889890 /NCGR_PEP_ID=MMETSP0107_2-20121207/47519_1 /TAXON_ID=195067 ORGANISM="Goniomonas pacifica, Strain CCMP1869" /NCGR_SAMPLE_ID=MMETSP0107_2 /ASSEMBLY_ACC=CAM_ASM_000203 /LENGTH=132 /DNA_ID=CAMNT_0017210585 /DNA_START=97 /DNA_END=495 /DNA_ORIENTATION=-